MAYPTPSPTPTPTPSLVPAWLSPYVPSPSPTATSVPTPAPAPATAVPLSGVSVTCLPEITLPEDAHAITQFMKIHLQLHASESQVVEATKRALSLAAHIPKDAVLVDATAKTQAEPSGSAHDDAS